MRLISLVFFSFFLSTLTGQGLDTVLFKTQETGNGWITERIVVEDSEVKLYHWEWIEYNNLRQACLKEEGYGFPSSEVYCDAEPGLIEFTFPNICIAGVDVSPGGTYWDNGLRQAGNPVNLDIFFNWVNYTYPLISQR